VSGCKIKRACTVSARKKRNSDTSGTGTVTNAGILRQEPTSEVCKLDGTGSCFNGPDNYWKDWPTESPLCGDNDGISEILDGISFSKWRTESIKGYGNAIVPQLAYKIFQAIESVEQEKSK
jgi:hypothetical protein